MFDCNINRYLVIDFSETFKNTQSGWSKHEGEKGGMGGKGGERGKGREGEGREGEAR